MFLRLLPPYNPLCLHHSSGSWEEPAEQGTLALLLPSTVSSAVSSISVWTCPIQMVCIEKVKVDPMIVEYRLLNESILGSAQTAIKYCQSQITCEHLQYHYKVYDGSKIIFYTIKSNKNYRAIWREAHTWKNTLINSDFIPYDLHPSRLSGKKWPVP